MQNATHDCTKRLALKTSQRIGVTVWNRKPFVASTAMRVLPIECARRLSPCDSAGRLQKVFSHEGKPTISNMNNNPNDTPETPSTRAQTLRVASCDSFGGTSKSITISAACPH